MDYLASEAVEKVLEQLDITLSALRDAVSGGKDLADVEAAIKGLQSASETLQSVIDAVSGLKGTGLKDFTTLETDVESILSKLDITLSALRDALQGSGGKDFTTLETDVEAVHTAVKGQRTGGATGQVSVGTGGAQLPSHVVAPGCEVAIWADPDNTAKVAINIGGAADTSTNALLAAGQGVSLAVSNTNLIYLKAASGTQTIYWAVEV